MSYDIFEYNHNNQKRYGVFFACPQRTAYTLNFQTEAEAKLYCINIAKKHGFSKREVI